MGDRLFDWLYGVIARPVGTLNEIAREKPAGWGFFIYLAVSLLSGAAVTFQQYRYGMVDEAMQEFAITIPPVVLIIGGFFFTVVSLFVFTLALHLFARLFGGRGGYWNFFSAYTFASFPSIIGVPVSFLAALLGWAGMLLSSLAGFGISIWVLVLHVIALRESHGLSTGMSVLAYIITFVILFAIPVALAIAAIIALFAF